MTFLRDHAAGIGAAATAIGGALYVLLSVISSWVYSPVGVTPAQVGLGYGPLLIGAAAFLLWIAAVGAVFVALAVGTTWLTARIGRWAWAFVALFAAFAVVALVAGDPWTAALAASVPVAVAAGRRWGRRRYAMSAAIGTLFVGVVGVGAILWGAGRARDDIAAGQRTSGAWSGPWTAQVVSVRPTGAATTAPLPARRCLLYLGEANGMSVLYDGEARTVRVPTTGLVLEIHADAFSAAACER